MVSITPRVSYMERSDWDNSGQPRLGYSVARSVRTELIVHHTVAIDNNDGSPLVWETDAEVINHMRLLRTIRPDLGLDVPYNFVAFMRPNLTLTVCEGRGLDRAGAHTHAHNTSGVATSMAGDFHNYPLGDFLSPFVLALNDWFHWQKGQLPNLQVINGHRDYNGTACPGKYLYATKGGWTWEQGQEDWFDMATKQELKDALSEVINAKRIDEMLIWERNIGGLEWRFIRQSGLPHVYLLAYEVSGLATKAVSFSRHHIPNPFTFAVLGGKPDGSNIIDISGASMAAIPDGTPIKSIGG